MTVRRGGGGFERGQSTVEYVGLVLLVSLLALGSLAAIGNRVPGGELARAIADRLVCAVRGPERCSGEDQRSELARAYGYELAALVEQLAPRIAFDDVEGVALPVDFRRCRERSCSDTDAQGPVWRSRSGERATAFVHVVDCREGGPRPTDADCTGRRAGSTYIQYHLYYPDSATKPLHKLPGEPGFHLDDWEGYQLRIDPDGSLSARASSHKSWNGRSRSPIRNGLSDAGWRRRRGWDAEGVGDLRVTDGSHAGSIGRHRREGRRWIPAERLRLVPLDRIARRGDRWSFAVSPPWRKRAWTDPETDRT